MQSAALELDYLSTQQLDTRPSSWWNEVLGMVGFAGSPPTDRTRAPIAVSRTPPLGRASDVCEVWRAAGAGSAPLEEGPPRGACAAPRVRYRFGRDLLFGSFESEERTPEGSAALARATLDAYGEIFEILRVTEYPHLIRVWNYLPEITRDADGEERYRHFNAARQAAFRDSGRAATGSVPAASALGSPAGSPISIYFLASRKAPLMIENPRQTSAYHYPPKFGVYSPSFSRACLVNALSGTNLFVSGTASIVGSETRHVGDVTAQTSETLTNIEALLDAANRAIGGTARYSLDALKYKVYVRRPGDHGAIEAALSMRLRTGTPIVYLQAEVCRKDLLVEIEAAGASNAR